MTGVEAELLGTFVLLQVGDGATTIFALSRPQIVEGNGFARRLMSRFGVVPVVLACKLACILLTVALVAGNANLRVKLALLATGCLLYGQIVADNVRLVWKHRR